MGLLTSTHNAGYKHIGTYREALKDCTPVGRSVNSQVGVLINACCQADDRTALEIGERAELVVVDYKTDILETEEEMVERTRRYRLQGGAYALAIEAATKLPVKEVIFLFLQPEGEVVLQELPAAIEEAEKAASL